MGPKSSVLHANSSAVAKPFAGTMLFFFIQEFSMSIKKSLADLNHVTTMWLLYCKGLKIRSVVRLSKFWFIKPTDQTRGRGTLKFAHINSS